MPEQLIPRIHHTVLCLSDNPIRRIIQRPYAGHTSLFSFDDLSETMLSICVLTIFASEDAHVAHATSSHFPKSRGIVIALLTLTPKKPAKISRLWKSTQTRLVKMRHWHCTAKGLTLIRCAVAVHQVVTLTKTMRHGKSAHADFWSW